MSTKIKIKQKPEGHDVLVLTKHPMETGQRVDKNSGEIVPAHHITSMLFAVNGTQITEVSLSRGTSANPLVAINLQNLTSGDTVSVSWVDNLDGSGAAEATVK
ncbi:MAG: sulfur-oxidizing protein SoxZ [Saprospiraceae bacterium]|jgi:sulfur-oxidizing protein SoxZ